MRLPKPGGGSLAGDTGGLPNRERRQGQGWGLVAGTAGGCASGFSLEEVHTDVQEEGAEGGFVVLLGIRVTPSLDQE